MVVPCRRYSSARRSGSSGCIFWVRRRCCRYSPAGRSGASMITAGTGPSPCSPPWRSPPARSPGACKPRQEFLAFLKQVARAYPNASCTWCGQLRRSQTHLGPKPAGGEPTDHGALRTHLRLLAEPGRGVVRHHRTPSHPPRHVRISQRTQRSHPRLRQRMERPLPPARLGQSRRPDPQEGPPSNNFKLAPQGLIRP